MDNGALAPGQVFAERFELFEVLIRSRLGTAYRAYDRDLDEVVALMVLGPQAETHDGVEQLRRQVRLARKVTHHNIARTFDLADYAGRHFITVEYVDGVRLPEWLATKPSAGALLDIAAQVGEGLAAAHAVGVVHANLAPANLMVDRDDRAVLGNFGLARFDAAETVAQACEGSQGLLRTAVYLAPEQIRGLATTPAVDVFALGLLIYEMWVQQPRYSGDSPAAVANARLDDSLLDLREGPLRDARIPAALAAILVECLAGEPSARPEVAAVAAALRRVSADASVTDGALEAASPATPGRHDSLAVLPFRFRGPRDSDYLADALVDELVDLLSQTRGLRVFGAGATARFTDASERDPRRVGAELGVDVIVDGTILLAGDRLRISARLIEVEGGFQLWHERFEGCVADVFELQDKLAKRIAEALRVELGIIAHRGEVDVEAIESYLRARQAHLRWVMFGPTGAIAHYRAALDRAPTFKPAIAHLAAATVLAWFQPSDDGVDWGHEATLAVARAVELAPELPETLLAAGNLAAQHGEHGEAARHLRDALRVAPTFALAHEFFGRILLEAGREREGLEHLNLAVELDSRLSYCLADVARHCALMGDMDGFRSQANRLVERLEFHRPSTGMLYIRVGGWTGDEDMIRAGITYLEGGGERVAGLRRVAKLMLMLMRSDLTREAVDAEIQAQYRLTLSSVRSPRLETLVEQLIAEVTALHGDDQRALEHIERASARGLADMVWLDHCPLFERLRDEPRFVTIRDVTRARCEAVQSALS